jgi:hypothetical protein
MKAIAWETDAKFLDSMDASELGQVLDTIGKYYVPTHEWTSEVEMTTTVPVRSDLGVVLMFVASAFVLALWIGNYRHYKTSF